MKTIKLGDDNYLDSISLVHNGNKLKDILDKIIYKQNTTPIGNFTIWEGNKLIDANNTKIGTFYFLKNSIEKRYPLKSGYVRKAKLCIDESDSKTSGTITLTIKFYDNSKSYNYNFDITWGSTDDNIRTTKTIDFDYNTLISGHVDLLINNISGSHIRIYKVYLIIYDELL